VADGSSLVSESQPTLSLYIEEALIQLI